MPTCQISYLSDPPFAFLPSACRWSGTPWLIVAPSLWACGPQRPPSPRRLGRPQVEAPHQDSWRKWAQPLTSMAKAELDQICWTTLLKDFCNNTSVFLQHRFCISATLRLNGTSFVKKREVIYCGPQLTSFDVKKMWRHQNSWHSLKKCSFFVTHTFSLLTGGSNWPFRCLEVTLLTLDWQHGW